MTPARPLAPDERRGFATTQWSVVVRAGGEGTEAARAALAELCETYWYPLYAYARRRGGGEHEAQDLVQGFFAELLEKGWLRAADPERGRFRAFLVTTFRHHAGRARDRARAQRRGGGRVHLSLDFRQGEERYRQEPAGGATPEAVYERRWALTVLERVTTALREECLAAGKEGLFEALAPALFGTSPAPRHRETAEALGMTEGAVKVALHRLRQRYRELLREEIGRTVDGPAEVDVEIRHLMEALGA